MGLIDTARSVLRNLTIPPWPPGVDNYWPYANLAQGYSFPLLDLTQPGGREEEIESSFAGYVRGAYKGNSVVFAAMAARQMLFSEARFQFQRLEKGRPGDLFSDASLAILEHPSPTATTGDLLNRAIADNDLAGNFFATRRRNRIVRMRPDWVTMVVGTNDPDATGDDLDAELLGIIYHPGGEYSGSPPVNLLRSEICNFSLYPDPLAHYRGMSWLTPILRDIQSDTAATTHKQRFFENGATPNLIVKRPDAPSPEMFKQWRDLIEAGHRGAANAYKTLYLTAGADATVVGKDLQQLEFRATQGAGETRIAAAARVPAAILGISEGLQGSSLNAGNFTAARRLFADGFARPAWRNFAGSMETLVPPPAGTRLWYDARDINFLREDAKDAAEIFAIKAGAMRQLIDAGFEADSVVKATAAENETLLKHSGLFSVQLQEPGTPDPAVPVEAAPPQPNGKPKPTPAGAK